MSEGRTERGTVLSSEELFATVAPGVDLCYQTFGDPSDDPLVLVMGLGGPMTWWDDRFCEALALAGFFVVRYDNRDVGRSSRMEGRVTKGTLVRAFCGLKVAAAYTVRDLADDVVGLLDHLGIGSAHVVGVSMGGMVAQTLTLAHPDRVRSLTSIMSTTGKRTVGWQHPSLLPILLGKAAGKEAYIASAIRTWNVIGSPAYPVDDDDLAARADETYERGVSLAGTGRQMVAVLTQPDRTRALRRVQVPTLVIHGLADRMVHVSGGRTTALSIPGSELLLIAGMGHDMPEPLWPTFVKAIRGTADRAQRAPHPA